MTIKVYIFACGHQGKATSWNTNSDAAGPIYPMRVGYGILTHVRVMHGGWGS